MPFALLALCLQRVSAITPPFREDAIFHMWQDFGANLATVGESRARLNKAGHK